MVLWSERRSEARAARGIDKALNAERQDGEGKNDAAQRGQIFHVVIDVHDRTM